MSRQKLVPCMPPLLEEEVVISELKAATKYSGTACENVVKAWMMLNNINVAEPHVDDGVDVLIEKPGEGWVRGQVKKVVYTNKVDHGMKKRNGVEVYRSRFNFPFQSGNAKWGRRQRTIDEIDYFYHVLITPHRTLIWEIPASIVPLREGSKEFIFAKNPCIDREAWIRKKSEWDFNDYLLSAQFSRKVIESYPDFFNPPEQGTLELIL